MDQTSLVIFVLVSALTVFARNESRRWWWGYKYDDMHGKPSHCTIIRSQKRYWFYQQYYRFDYPHLMIPSGRKDSTFMLYCVNPPHVAETWVKACDWFSAPRVIITPGDELLHIIRFNTRDEGGYYRNFKGEASVDIVQLCMHNLLHYNGQISKPNITE
ncbi:hypothetical protein evm_003016 [Chilo suppressalis]|nr:hypothetical protein evm_003016 [Chilo suppressalis]